MDDGKIVALFWERSEDAIAETKKKYDKYCMYIAHNILHNTADAEECTGDAYFRLWNLIPPAYPEKLSVFLGKIVRGIAIDRLRKNLAEKRRENGDANEAENTASSFELEKGVIQKDIINRFVASLPREARIIFVRRYWYMDDVRGIAQDMKISESKVKTSLFRTRKLLSDFIEKEGFHQ